MSEKQLPIDELALESIAQHSFLFIHEDTVTVFMT
jgi:hypothetical protein